jgi:protocatechuate 3,4-dioxygenase beta subunit
MVRRLCNPTPVWHAPATDPVPRRAFLGLAAYAVGGIAIARAQGQSPGTCVLTPDSGEGPFYFDPNLVREDVTDGQPGAPLELGVQVVRARDCATLEQARVDVWHADALGLYSGYERQSGVGGVSTSAVVGKSFLRGTQFTNAEGRVVFRTIYPSWYGGRTPHVHFKIFLSDDEVVASQIFFPDDVNDRVFNEWAPYREHVAKRMTRNADDTFLRDRVGGVFCEAEESGDGVDSSVVIAINQA